MKKKAISKMPVKQQDIALFLYKTEITRNSFGF